MQLSSKSALAVPPFICCKTDLQKSRELDVRWQGFEQTDENAKEIHVLQPGLDLSDVSDGNERMKVTTMMVMRLCRTTTWAASPTHPPWVSSVMMMIIN